MVTLAQVYYDNTTPFAGSYLLIGITGIDVQRQDDTHLTACIAYEAATLSSPDTLVDSNTRLFTLVLGSDGAWQEVQMDASNSCSLN